MKRTASALCIAAAMAWGATLAAQQPGTRATTTDKASHDVSVTGCLAKDASGGFTLNNAKVDTGQSSTTTSSSSTTAAGTTTTSSTTTTSAPAMSWMLMGGTDLEKHVGHKIQVTGKTEWNGSTSHPISTAPAAGVGTTAAQPAPT